MFNKPAPLWRPIPDEPQSQQTSFPGSLWTSSIMALVRSSRLFSPVLCSPRKAMVRASSLLFVNTEIHLLSKQEGDLVFSALQQTCVHQEIPEATPLPRNSEERRKRKKQNLKERELKGGKGHSRENGRDARKRWDRAGQYRWGPTQTHPRRRGGRTGEEWLGGRVKFSERPLFSRGPAGGTLAGTLHRAFH